MAIKFYCDIEGLTDNWIELSDKWTQKEAKAAAEAMDGGWADYVAALKPKIVSCKLVAGDVVIDDFTDVNESALDLMDVRLIGFVSGILQQTTMRLRALGNVSARVSSSGVAGTK